ncbi:TetR/AcrR family transcriptional regulator [Kitasatospora sp. NPDC096147]|uniref:TetR/AcrR family transcriptional regulator n=1 Tax=Kitasatospora sp. NPDC096147 TaxID=3364093 RepID=UPI00380EB836
MTSSPRRPARAATGPRTRKAPAERRAEILDAAARLALTEGLERVTMQLVADHLGVRPGLIGHYFPTIETLLAEAFTHAATRERRSLLPPAESDLPPLRRLALFLHRVSGPDFTDLDRLWLNARHLSRYRPTLHQAVADQEAEMRTELTTLIEDGVAAGEFTTTDPPAACLLLLVVIDGLGSYANDTTGFTHPALAALPRTTAEQQLGLTPGTLTLQQDAGRARPWPSGA